MRAAILFAPHRRLERSGIILVTREVPVGALVAQQVHLQHPPAPAGTQHRGLFFNAIFVHNVKHAALQFFWQRFLDH
jgi:hypothetical protein